MIVEREEYNYLSGKGPIEQIGIRWTFKCDNPACGKVFERPNSKNRAYRSRHYCCHPCSTNHVFGTCTIDGCDNPLKSQSHKRGKYPDLCSKHKKAAMRKERTARNRAEMFELMGNKCVCCGETDAVFFQVDHVHNDADYAGTGNRAGSVQLHQYLEEPERYQLLCANCNHAKRMNNGELYLPKKFTPRKIQEQFAA